MIASAHVNFASEVTEEERSYRVQDIERLRSLQHRLLLARNSHGPRERVPLDPVSSRRLTTRWSPLRFALHSTQEGREAH